MIPEIARGRRPRHATRGQVLVEFAFACLFMMTILFGIIEFGLALFAYDTVSNSARMGSRWAMVRGSGCSGCQATTATVQAYVQSISNGLILSQLVVTPTWSNTSTCTTLYAAGCLVAVKVQYTFYTFYKVAPITISSTSQMVISQ